MSARSGIFLLALVLLSSASCRSRSLNEGLRSSSLRSGSGSTTKESEVFDSKKKWDELVSIMEGERKISLSSPQDALCVAEWNKTTLQSDDKVQGIAQMRALAKYYDDEQRHLHDEYGQLKRDRERLDKVVCEAPQQNNPRFWPSFKAWKEVLLLLLGVQQRIDQNRDEVVNAFNQSEACALGRLNHVHAVLETLHTHNMQYLALLKSEHEIPADQWKYLNTFLAEKSKIILFNLRDSLVQTPQYHSEEREGRIYASLVVLQRFLGFIEDNHQRPNTPRAPEALSAVIEEISATFERGQELGFETLMRVYYPELTPLILKAFEVLKNFEFSSQIPDQKWEVRVTIQPLEGICYPKLEYGAYNSARLDL